MKIYTNPNSQTWSFILARPMMDTQNLNSTVSEILQKVKNEGDTALNFFNKKFDQVELENIEVTEEEIAAAESQLDGKLKKAIQVAYQNITKFHAAQKTETLEVETMRGVKCWQKSVAIEKVGLYIPGGTAPLFSTILMLGIPAKVAGCQEVVMCSPPQKDGKINAAMLYTAKLVGIEKIFKVGGAQAIGAMTFGTETIPQVYKIFGPGNQFVTTAKQLVGQEGVAIDMPAGPSEVLIVADESCEPSFVAADLLSQAEHGMDSQVVLITFSEETAEAILAEGEQQLKQLPRKKIAGEALENSPVIIFDNKASALKLINEYAPEHLIIATKDADDFSKKIINAGSVFIGNFTPESVGDYASGTNHTLPTNGFAKNYSGVNLDAFSKKITYQKLTKEGLLNLGPTVELMAEAEQLEGHKKAVTIRLNNISTNSKKEIFQKRNIQNLVRPNILKMHAYSSARSEFEGTAEVFLDANENPFDNGMNRYPDPLQNNLKVKIGAWRNIPKENIFLGNGSDEIIGLLMQTFCQPKKDGVIVLPPTFGVYEVATTIGEIGIKKINLDKNFQPKVNVILNAADLNDKILFICSPNNPTGNSFDFKKIKKLINEFDGIVVVDEAYIDFSKNDSCLSLLKKNKNLIILQTFSKALGMAGARLGMAFASEEIVSFLNKVKMPYNINELTQKAALQSLEQKNNFKQQVKTILEQRFFLEKELLQFDFIEKIFPSDANFLLVKVNEPNQLYQFLVSRKIIVRNRSTQVGCKGCLRFTIGLEKENLRLIETLHNYCSKEK